MGRSRSFPLVALLLGVMLGLGSSCHWYDDDDYYYYDDDDCYWVDDELICVRDDDNHLVGKFQTLPRTETGVLLKGAADARFSRVLITITRIELLGENTEIVYDDPNGLEADLCRGASQNNVYDRVLAKASVAPGSCRAVRITYTSAACVPSAGAAITPAITPTITPTQASDGEVILDLDAPVPMGPGERRYFVVTFDLAATLTRTTSPTSAGGVGAPENDSASLSGGWIMWPRGEARLYRPAQALMR